MSGKPTQQEEEYFARLEFEQRRKDLAAAQGRCAKSAPAVAKDPSVLDSILGIFTSS
jgi:hypothetical protein